MRKSYGLFLIILPICVFFTQCNSGNKKVVNSNGQELYKRMDLETILYGKPKSYVQELLGKPDKEQELGAINRYYYYYNMRTYSLDPAKPDNTVIIGFDDWLPASGKVDFVKFK
jgi:outer membrane protein assembly factor BamE (lipoprotein component of BamABCDE complex)